MAVAILLALEHLDYAWLNPLLRIVRRHGFWQFVRFIAVGSLNFAFYYSIFAGLHLLGVAPTPSVLIATVVAVLFNFCTTGQIVFRSRRAWLLPKFIAVYIVQTLLNVGSLRALIAIGVPVLAAEALVIGVLAVLTFFALKRFVFSEAVHAEAARARSG
ncbi:MAG TPA: GtrA family protein [Allosphingosinicella sp.]